MSDADIDILRRLAAVEQRLGQIYNEPSDNILASAISAHLALPELRGFWPMSASQATNLIESLGPPRQLSVSGGYGRGITAGLLPYVTLASAGSNYLARADETGLRGSDILWGGLTWGGWFKFTSLPAAPGADMQLVSKFGAVIANQEYALYQYNNAGVQIAVCSVGSGAALTYNSLPFTPTIGVWYHYVARWVASSTLDIFINGVKTSAACAYAALAGGVSNFTIGAINAGSFLNGSATLCFLAGYPLSDAHIQALYTQAASLFP